MSKYYVNYHTGAGNYEFEGTLEEAIEDASTGLAYTQQNVGIEDEDDKQVAFLPWWGVQPEEDDYVTEQFGSYGFYGEWVIE
ncbi:MAG: hypothetical protein WCS56_04725 [Bacilli bacterium]|jgi:peptidase E